MCPLYHPTRGVAPGLQELQVVSADPDPVRSPVDEEEGSGDARVVGHRGAGGHGADGDPGGGGGAGEGRDGFGIQEEADPAGIVVPTSTIIPVELGLQLDEATLVGLEIIEEGHASAPFIQLSHSISQPA